MKLNPRRTNMHQPLAIVILIPIILFVTPVSAILKSGMIYWSLLLASLLFPWIAFEIVQHDLGIYDENWFVVSVSLTTALWLYKLFDRCILKLKGRPLFITWRHHTLPLKESWLDLIFQYILIFLPLTFLLIGRKFFH